MHEFIFLLKLLFFHKRKNPINITFPFCNFVSLLFVIFLIMICILLDLILINIILELVCILLVYFQ